MKNKLGVFSHIAIDAVRWRDATEVLESIGGAGAYAAVGAALASQEEDQPILVAGVGATQRMFFEWWCSEHAVDSAGLFRIPYSVPITLVCYRAEQDRTEVPLLGLDHFVSATPLPMCVSDEILAGMSWAYVFHNEASDFWMHIDTWRKSHHVKVGWEVAKDACSPEKLTRVMDIASTCHVVFLNREEAQALLGSSDEEDVSKGLSRFATTVVLHDGPHPVRVWSREGYFEVPVSEGVKVIDPTGGGNAFCGAVLARLNTGSSLVEAVRFGCAVSAYVIGVRGAPTVDSCNRQVIFEAYAKLSAQGNLGPSTQGPLRCL